VIKETITFTFENEDQQRAFHKVLDDRPWEPQKQAKEMVEAAGLDPKVFWQLVDDIYCAIVNAGFDSTFGVEDSAVIKLVK
jgi:hypothetical protein